jgi:hypothetical protein
MNNQEKHIDLFDLLGFVTNRWLFLTICMIAGGLAGLLFSCLRAPLYESSAAFGVNIDYTQTGTLTDLEEDQAMRGVGSVLLSDPLVEETLSLINREGLFELSEDEFRQNAFADRGDFRWVIRYRGTDPQRIFQITQIWADSARDNFDMALAHAQTAEAYLKMLADLQSCYQESGMQPPLGMCGFSDSGALLDEITSLSEKIKMEKVSSQGLFYALSINLINGAYLPQYPIRFQTNLLVITGAFIGLLPGITYLIYKYIRGRWIS